MKRKLIQVHYLDGEVVEFENETLETVTHKTFQERLDPEKIVLDNETTLDWNPFLFHQFMAEGSINEDELIRLTKRN